MNELEEKKEKWLFCFVLFKRKEEGARRRREKKGEEGTRRRREKKGQGGGGEKKRKKKKKHLKMAKRKGREEDIFLNLPFYVVSCYGMSTYSTVHTYCGVMFHHHHHHSPPKKKRKEEK